MINTTGLPVWPWLCWLFWLSRVAVGADFYVATNGHDEWSGTLASPNAARSDGPFATLEQARNTLRDEKRKSKATESVTVWIRAGTYARERSFELTATDSGTSQATVAYRAYMNETPRLLGGQILRGFAPVTEGAVKERLPMEARAQVFQVNLREQGITNLGRLQSRGFGRPWRAGRTTESGSASRGFPPARRKEMIMAAELARYLAAFNSKEIARAAGNATTISGCMVTGLGIGPTPTSESSHSISIRA
jgi:hypothetical protein